MTFVNFYQKSHKFHYLTFMCNLRITEYRKLFKSVTLLSLTFDNNRHHNTTMQTNTLYLMKNESGDSSFREYRTLDGSLISRVTVTEDRVTILSPQKYRDFIQTDLLNCGILPFIDDDDRFSFRSPSQIAKVMKYLVLHFEFGDEKEKNYFTNMAGSATADHRIKVSDVLVEENIQEMYRTWDCVFRPLVDDYSWFNRLHITKTLYASGDTDLFIGVTAKQNPDENGLRRRLKECGFDSEDCDGICSKGIGISDREKAREFALYIKRHVELPSEFHHLIDT